MGNRIVIKVSAGTLSRFRMSVFYWKAAPSTLFDPELDLTSQPRPAITETFDSLSVTESSPDYYEKRVNGISNLINLSEKTGDSGGAPDTPAGHSGTAQGAASSITLALTIGNG
ncbi:MAG: hypothetical protein MZU95_12285 [Desulfomicrobium escambiense]|nr:hypothetical protein [Desulfomicrobium escambiense]